MTAHGAWQLVAWAVTLGIVANAHAELAITIVAGANEASNDIFVLSQTLDVVRCDHVRCVAVSLFDRCVAMTA